MPRLSESTAVNIREARPRAEATALVMGLHHVGSNMGSHDWA